MIGSVVCYVDGVGFIVGVLGKIFIGFLVVVEGVVVVVWVEYSWVYSDVVVLF